MGNKDDLSKGKNLKNPSSPDQGLIVTFKETTLIVDKMISLANTILGTLRAINSPKKSGPQQTENKFEPKK